MDDQSIYLSKMRLDADSIPQENVECYKCGEQEMFQVKLTYDKYSEMTLKEREDYADSWLYIHLRNLKEQHV